MVHYSLLSKVDGSENYFPSFAGRKGWENLQKSALVLKLAVPPPTP